MPAYGNLFLDKHVIVTSGPTREHLDPVRYLSNESSGKQGHAIAAAFAAAGARVTLISGPVNIADPAGVTCVHIISARDMLKAAQDALPADIAIFAAAVADFRPKNYVGHKIKKRAGGEPPHIELTENPDVLKTIGHHKNRPQVVVGFAAETNDIIDYARGKLTSKNADMILANDVSGDKIMGKDVTHLYAVTKTGADDWGDTSKLEAADRIVAAVAKLIKPNFI